MPTTRRAPGTDQFPCESCGALQTFRPGSRVLACAWCGHETAIPEARDALAQIREYDFHEALAELADAPDAAQRPATRCGSCAAEFDFDAHVHAGVCPFCGTPVVTATGEDRRIKPKSLLPFRLDEREAGESFRRWLGRLWFAPSALTRRGGGDTRLTGVYLPYWTYDSRTTTRYRGQRGTIYHVPRQYTTVVDGKRVTRTRMEQRVRWTPARGTVSRSFDDVLVGATLSLPRRITDSLGPWDLDALEPYDERFLSGYRSEIYQVDLDDGFRAAAETMNRVIRDDVARDIGGDLQRITSLDTRHSDTTFKHVLLPVWSAGFRFRDRVYRFVVNGRTGKVVGERPWSRVKIALAVIAALGLAALLFYLFAEPG